jgi:hypothetical protein
MDRGYIRVRKGGPDESVQRQALAAAGVNVDEMLGAVYVDGLSYALKRRKLDPNDPHPQRTWAIRHLCPGDVLVIYDVATLGTSSEDIFGALVAIDRQDATLKVVETGMTYRWHPAAADIAALARMGSEQARREKTSEARKRLARMPRKITPEAAARALELWSDPTIRSAKEVVAVLRGEGIKVCVRTLYENLKIGRADAIESREPKSDRITELVVP